MLSKLQSYWNYGTTFCSIEIATLKGERCIFSVSSKKKNGEFKEFQFSEASSLNELSKFFSKDQHAFLTINTDKVLIKETPLTENNQKMLAQAFPGLSLTEFYYQILKTESKCFVSVCRKDYVDEILKEAERQNFNILGINLGFTLLSKLIPFLDEKEILAGKYLFYLENQAIVSFKENLGEINLYKIEDNEVSSNHLIVLSGLFNYISNDDDDTSNLTEGNVALKKLHIGKNFFKKGFKVGIGILLLTLLINFFLFESYYKENQQLNEEVRLLESQNEAFMAKVVSIESKERMVASILNNGGSKSSFYLNRVVESKPPSILFVQFQFQPLTKSIRPDKKIEYTHNTVLISGESSNKEIFSQWIEFLEQLEWIDKVIVVQYGWSKEDASNFKIELQLKS